MYNVILLYSQTVKNKIKTLNLDQADDYIDEFKFQVEIIYFYI